MQRSLILLVALVLLSACAATQPTPTPVPPTPTPSAPGTPVLSAEDRARVAAWGAAWASVERFRVEITAYDSTGTLRQRLEAAVVLPDRLHALQYDPSTGQLLQEWIIVGDAGWIRSGDRWQLGRIEQPPDLGSLYDPEALATTSHEVTSVSMQALPPETIDGTLCETWQIVVEPVGQEPNRLTLWIGRSDQLPRRLRTEYPDGSVLLLRYWGFDEAFTVEPPTTSQ